MGTSTHLGAPCDFREARTAKFDHREQHGHEVNDVVLVHWSVVHEAPDFSTVVLGGDRRATDGGLTEVIEEGVEESANMMSNTVKIRSSRGTYRR